MKNTKTEAYSVVQCSDGDKWEECKSYTRLSRCEAIAHCIVLRERYSNSRLFKVVKVITKKLYHSVLF